MRKFTLFLFVLFFSLSIWAYNFTSGGFYYNIISSTAPYTVGVTYATTNYNSYSGTVIIPSTVTYNGITYTVISIQNYAFFNCVNLTSATILSSVTSIEASAFSYCVNLASVTIPNSVTSIKNLAFQGCSNLVSVAIPSSVTSIGDDAFYDCSGLTSISAYPTTPVDLSSSPNAFTGVSTSSCTLYVPTVSINEYDTATVWKNFSHIVAMTSTGVQTEISGAVNIYPNPVTDGFQITGLSGTYTLTLTDLNGRTLFAKILIGNEYISVSSLPKGLYVAKITSSGGTIEKKLLKQ
jgi:hypothetical protein